MEKRALIAIVLSVAIPLAWQLLFVPPAPPPSAPVEKQAPATTGSPGGSPGEGAAPGSSQAPVVVPRPALPAAAQTGRTVDVSTPLYRASFGPDGSVTAWDLSYRGTK